MKGTGLIRKIDDLGRIVIPRDVRKEMCIYENDPFEIFIDENGIYLKKYNLRSDIENAIIRAKLCVLDNRSLSEDTSKEILRQLSEIEKLLKN